MNQKKTSISKESHNQEKLRQPNSQNSPAVFVGVNVNQLHLTAHDLKSYEDAYEGCAKDVLRIIEKTLDNQSKAEELIQKTNQEILTNEKLKIGNFKHKIYLSFFLSALTLIAGCYLISHPAAWAQIVGVALILAVCVSAFEVKVISNLKNIFRSMFKH